MSESASASPGEVTRVLADLRGGDRGAYDRLVPLVHGALHSIARRLMRDERCDHALQATALVNEAVIRLLGEPEPSWRDRGQLLAVAAGAMRRILVDQARERDAAKRGGAWTRVTLEESTGGDESSELDILELHAALEKLAALDARQARIVELRYFGGLTLDETADCLGVSAVTVSSDWAMARAWLYARLGGGR
ncbi:MAG: ECF-type sigma factor [Acidobacteriota bacterium]